MIDPVSEELTQRAGRSLPWGWALVASLGLHLAALAGLLVASKPRAKALTLPAVRVHLATPQDLGNSSPSPEPAPSSAAKTGSPVQTQKATAPPPQRQSASQRSKVSAPVGGSRPLAQEKSQANPDLAPGVMAGRGAGDPREQAGALGSGLAVGAGDGQPFPYDYYLQRVLATIEQNWFKPDVLAGTRARVRCRISRSGQLLEAGLEESSNNGTFDRACLRAVFAASPFPPLPQGFLGTELILHLEFVQ